MVMQSTIITESGSLQNVSSVKMREYEPHKQQLRELKIETRKFLVMTFCYNCNRANVIVFSYLSHLHCKCCGKEANIWKPCNTLYNG
jgi:hypothetical protein